MLSAPVTLAWSLGLLLPTQRTAPAPRTEYEKALQIDSHSLNKRFLFAFKSSWTSYKVAFKYQGRQLTAQTQKVSCY